MANDTRWQFAYQSPEALSRVPRAVRVLERLSENAYNLREARRRLVDGYRITGLVDRAVQELEALCRDSTLPLDERVTFTRDLVWVLLAEIKDPDEDRRRRASALIDQLWSQAGTGDQQRQLVLPLLIDKARIKAREPDLNGAKAELDKYFAQLNKTSFYTNYGDYAEACLLRGFVREAAGDKAGAQDAWQEGLLKNWPRGTLPLLPRGRKPGWLEINSRDNTLLYSVIVASLIDNLSDNDADEIYSNIIRGFGMYGTPVKVVIREAFPARVAQAVFRAVFRTDEGRKFARDLALRNVGLRDASIVPNQLLLLEGLRLGAFDGSMSAELEKIVRKQCADLAAAYGDGRIGGDEVTSVIRLWRGQEDPSGDWEVVLGAKVPELHVPLAYTFGRRYTKLKEDALARPFYQYVVDHATPADAVLKQLARQELDRSK
jgi:hypothetical protein